MSKPKSIILSVFQPEFVDALVAEVASRIGQTSPEFEATEGQAELPSPAEIKAIKKLDEAASIAGDLGLDVEGLKLAAVKKLLTTLSKVVKGEKVTSADAKSLCEALEIEPSKKLADTVASIQAFYESDEDAEEDDEEESEDDDDEEEEEDDSDDDDSDEEEEDEDDGEDEDEEDSEEDEDEEEEGLSPEEIVEESLVKFPKRVEMEKRLNAFNASTKKAAEKIKFTSGNLKSVKTAYKELAVLLVNNDAEISEWGEPYAADDEIMCCGRPLKEIKTGGQCIVTKKKFAFADLPVVDEEEEEEEDED